MPGFSRLLVMVATVVTTAAVACETDRPTPVGSSTQPDNRSPAMLVQIGGAWRLTSTAAPGGVFGFLGTIGDGIVGEYCVSCFPPYFEAQWCNATGTGPGWQIRNQVRFRTSVTIRPQGT